MKRRMKKKIPVGFEVSKISLAPDHLQKLIKKNRCEAVERYRARLTIELAKLWDPYRDKAIPMKEINAILKRALPET